MVYLATLLISSLVILVIFKITNQWNTAHLVSISGTVSTPKVDLVQLPEQQTPSFINETVEEETDEVEDKDELDLTHLTKGYDQINRLFLEHSTSDDINQLVISELCKQVKCYRAALYKSCGKEETISLIAGYGLTTDPDKSTINYGAGMLGQAVLDNQTIIMREIPSGYVKVASGLGQTDPLWIGIFPLSFKGKAYGVIELCFLYPESELIKNHIDKITELFGAHFFNQGVIAKQSQLEQLEQEKLRSEAILEGCADSFISFDKEGIIDFCNKSASELLQLDKNSILGQSITTLLDVSIERDEEDNFQLVHRGAESTILTEKSEIQISDANQEQISVLVTANTISVADNTQFTLFIQKISVDLF